MNASRVSESTVQSPLAFAIEDEVLAWVWLVRTCMLFVTLVSSYTTTDGVVYTDTHFVDFFWWYNCVWINFDIRKLWGLGYL